MRRYRTAQDQDLDGLPPGEGVLLPCSFWLADAYVGLGRMDAATRLFERLLTLRNDVGLLSEEYDPAAQRMVGNFPQAFIAPNSCAMMSICRHNRGDGVCDQGTRGFGRPARHNPDASGMRRRR